MNEFLLKHFVKDYENTQSPKVRLSYGTLGSVVGMLCNLALFIVKFIIGTIMHSVAITADGLNNLSDCITCIVSLLGYYISNKPADEDHPFGHGRMEYLFSFIASFSIFFVAYELFRESIAAIRNPTIIVFQLSLVIILILSIFVKVWMAQFYRYLAKKTDNTILYASSEDSKNDVLTTTITVISLLIGVAYPNIPVSGIVGIFVSVLIAKSGYELASDIIDHIIGKPVDANLIQSIIKEIREHDNVIDVHDLVIHDYGAGVKIGSGHVELDSEISFVEAHDIVDECEHEIKKKLGVSMTLHMDPVDLHNPERHEYYHIVMNTLKKIDPSMSLHDFRIIHHGNEKILAFDLMVPYTLKQSKEELEERIAKDLPDGIHLNIELDHNLIGANENENTSDD